ncbi:metal-sulfur cluster assembly factor [Haloplanus aerogenes]|uniref:Iron-sulfur cluster assembly protein n=1 Tax=Haloplanus aerogenes TaxID=660522 RepID=A0A3M0DQR6_9EURY|nr:iron-sulfur cluster assembly protein [Haloplanus aerogenes]AZH24515.1 iron-sulfur cluster assembly protein [Haloplanus aerogenes]RMB23835.1 metal-sulfur cluster biosynthetic enzyme [Haloplanus aerogenes]
MSTDSLDGGGDDGAVTERQVRDRLDRVTDPELDTSIVELEYIDEIGIDDGEIHVAFTLPTAWCSPAFAWMMATDARDEVEALPGVTRATVELREHMHDAEINRGVNERLSFGAAFPDADGDVAPVRAELDEKARLARQHDATGALLDAGLDGKQIVTVVHDDIEFDDDQARVWVRDGALAVSVDADPLERYLEKARATGLVDDDHPELFRTPEGDPIDPESFELVRHRTRSAGVNMSGQGSVCDALHEARRAADRPPLSSRSD